VTVKEGGAPEMFSALFYKTIEAQITQTILPRNMGHLFFLQTD
jgi:hypothetical protein